MKKQPNPQPVALNAPMHNSHPHPTSTDPNSRAYHHPDPPAEPMTTTTPTPARVTPPIHRARQCPPSRPTDTTHRRSNHPTHQRISAPQ